MRVAFLLASSPRHSQASVRAEIGNDYGISFNAVAGVNELAVECASHSNSNHGVQDLAKGELLIKVTPFQSVYCFFYTVTINHY